MAARPSLGRPEAIPLSRGGLSGLLQSPGGPPSGPRMRAGPGIRFCPHRPNPVQSHESQTQASDSRPVRRRRPGSADHGGPQLRLEHPGHCPELGAAISQKLAVPLQGHFSTALSMQLEESPDHYTVALRSPEGGADPVRVELKGRTLHIKIPGSRGTRRHSPHRARCGRGAAHGHGAQSQSPGRSVRPVAVFGRRRQPVLRPLG
jgi:hypothetical protein